MRLVTTTALALALTAPGYAVLAQEKAPEAKAGAKASGGVYMAKADKTDVFGSDFLGKEIYVKQTEAADEMAEGKADANAELAEGQEDAAEEMADAQDESAEEQAEAKQEASEEMADAQADAQEEVADANEDASEEMAEGPEWESIGEVSDVVMTRDGDVKAVLVDVGGFLGMGAKTVAITMEEISWQTEEGDDEPFLVLKSDRAALENAPEFEKNPEADAEMQKSGMTPAPTATTAGATMGTPPAADDSAETAMDEAETETEQALDSAGETLDEAATATAQMAQNAADSVGTAVENTGEAIDEAATETAETADEAADEATEETAAAPAGNADRLTKMDAAGYRQVEAAGLTAETVEGATVYDMGNEDIGEVVDLVLSADGAVDEAIIDVGGFLGLGEHRVAVRMSDLKVMQSDDDPDDLRVYVASTKEELEAMPEVEVDG
ncbi:PRC-barrel domain-containing protein [Albimonas pacifica]|uniref:PRC-barrel domain-containing protein n=2 Tax=Albimonas pacifica TaxID=1114924 RepID=A0A1I3IP14_9RHOB|nr:PRC-barrel domain-containing protein [Albimonas pacifica]